jgi:hypothetical protein
LQTSCLDTLQSVLSNSKNIPEEFCCKDNLTAFSQCFPFGTMLRASAQTIQKPQACLSNSERYQGNSPFVAGSRSRARTSVQPEKAQASPEHAQGFGLTWPESSVKFDRATSSWKIHPCLFPEDSMSCSVTLPRWGTCVGGELSERTMPELLTSGIGFGSNASWPTPQASDNRDRGHIGMPAIQRRQEKGKQIGLGQSVSDTSGALNPPWVEWLMAWPLGWTDLKPLVMDKFRQWQHSHGGCSHEALD